MACRFPGAPNLDAYWDLLEAGRSAITESIPGSGIGRAGEIFEDAEGARALCRFGGFLDDIDLFDPTFFRLSPIEAQITDPQQRLMLETSWRALEDAGLSHDRLQGTRTGVYTGVSNIEYRSRVMAALEESSERATALYANTGTGLNGVSGRVSYLLGLEGPALAVDTACSSSLVAMHEAARALKSGEVDIALAGGVNVILDPGRFEAFAIAGILSPDGQCKAFDASANGWVRGEGCGVVVLKRLSDAVADGDRIWSVVRGSAVNHDGAGADFTAPNPVAHRRVIHDALADAGIAPAEVDYLEAHGTGTVIGDPVEAAAVGTSYAEGRGPDRPLVIGSAKTNIGHLEPAAGIAGLIKTVLAMQRRVIPRHLNFDIPNPEIDWDKLPIRVAAESGEWPTRPGYPPLAAVSSFGMSGTNGHIILEGYEVPGATRGTDHEWVSGNASRVTVSLPEPFSDVEPAGGNPGSRPTRILALSAKNDPALRELAGRYQSWLEDRDAADLAIEDMVWTASTGRSHFNHRAGLPFSDLGSLRDQLTELEEGDAGPAPGSARKVAFAYSGQGGQWVGMGREIYETEPVARAVMDRCEAVHREVTGEPLLDVMFGRGGADGDLDASEWTQPALYALDVALTALWASVGIQPDAVIGHSFGELPAAQAAGAFSIEDGMRLAIARGRLLAETESGAMAAIFAPRERVESVIEEVNAASDRGLLGIAVDNGVNQTVGGLADEVDAISKLFEADEVRVRRLAISVVGHSGLLEPVLPALEAFANGIEIAQPNVDFVSNVTGDVLEPETALDGAYWRRHARRPVAFADGVRTLERLGVDTVIEIGPHAVLGPMVSMIWSEPPETPGAVAVIPSMLRPAERGGTEAERGFVEAVAAVYEAGLDVMFHGLYEGETRRRVSVPGYPFQLNSYWVDPPRRRRSDLGHALLGTRHESHRGEVSFDTEVAASEPAWLSDHRVFGRVVAPGALYGAMAATAVLSDHPDSAVIEDMQLHSPLIFPDKPAEGDDIAVPLQLVMEPPSGGSRRLEILSRMTGADWTLHVEGRVSDAGVPADNPLDVASVKSQMKLGSAPALYRARSSTGVELGPAFRGLTAVWEGPGEALGEIELPSEVERSGIAVHPLLLDACFQVVAGARGATEGDTTAYMPFGWERLWLTGPLPERLVCRAQMREGARGAAALAPEVLKADVWIYDEDGAPIGGVSGYTAKRATRAALLSSIDAIDDLLYEVIWRERPYAAPAVDVAVHPPGMWILAADQRGIATRVATGLAARNQTVVIAGPSQPDAGLPAGAIVRRGDPLPRETWGSLLGGGARGVPLRGGMCTGGARGARQAAAVALAAAPGGPGPGARGREPHTPPPGGGGPPGPPPPNNRAPRLSIEGVDPPHDRARGQPGVGLAGAGGDYRLGPRG
ncbi:MAG: type I polyketide synthase, partial [Chloroflexi bacterium]|nr:type I polyketide synthase [Chloroflexota bacterium]